MTRLLVSFPFLGILTLWAYGLRRALARQEFRDIGRWGWHPKRSDPAGFWWFVGSGILQSAGCAVALVLVWTRGLD